MSFVLSIKFNTRNAVKWFIEAKSVASKVKPPPKNGLTLSHRTFAVFTYLKYSLTIERRYVNSYKIVQHAVVSRNLSMLRTSRPNMYYGKEFSVDAMSHE